MKPTERDEKIAEIHETVIVLKTVLLGKNSDKGVVGQVNENSKKINKLYVILATLGGSGILTGAGVGIAKLIG